MQEKLNQLQEKIKADQGLRDELFSLETREEVQDFLREKGIEFTLEEIDTIKDSLVKIMAAGEKGELSDDALEGVAGGSALDDMGAGLYIIGKGIETFFRRW